jgi:predicted outer membrane repeat protein
MGRLSPSWNSGSLGLLLLAAGALALVPVAADAASTWQGTLASDTVWGPPQSPCTVAAELTVPAGVRLTILPGTIVLFPEGVRMVVQGCLTAEGTPEEPIRFTRAVNRGRWLGIQFRSTTQDNRIRRALFEYARTDDGMIGLEKSRLFLEHVEFDHCDRRRIRTVDSSLIVRRCRFHDIFGPGETPTTDNMSEHLWGSGIPDDGWLLLEENTFGLCKGHNDAVDFDGPARPHPIPHIRNNTFLGGGDDALDLECDALIEGNVFTNYVKDPYNRASGEANVLSAGAGMHYVLRNNLFVNAQHIVQVKNDAFLTFANNTAVSISGAAIYFDLELPGRKPGRGARVENSIFWKTPTAFEGVVDQTDLAVNYSCLPSSWHGFGAGNLDVDPLFVADADYHLKSQAGRWDAAEQRWISDDVTSPCIDASDPNADWTAELWPHGGRINLGVYGGTSQASMSLSVAGADADLDHNATVDAADLHRLSNHWLADASPLAEDLDRDGSVNLRDFARFASKWRIEPGTAGGPLEIALGRRAQWSSLYTGYDPDLPGYHLVGDIASVTLRAQTDDLPNRLLLAVQTFPGGLPMMEGFTFATPCLMISGEPFKEAGLAVSRRSDSSMPWQVASGTAAGEYFVFELLGDEVRITFLPAAIELLRTPCKLSWVDRYR